ncbi:E3 ubiquitin-protein ligase TM129 [Ischnura elegans]|uniref:E3 ubiquitin-protein ligase TM129 n=1 Tax=Ischnura elegans TaxID=197161 RepID=UPI001ED8B4F8|nr:E3 ubiquitin-protein ligase TM129 [Ischnura elegans]
MDDPLYFSRDIAFSTFTLFYLLFSICFIFPPSAFVSAGITVQDIFSKWLGSENEQFIQYNIRRTSATVLSHSFLPLGYVIGLTQCWNSGSFVRENTLLVLFSTVASVIPLVAGYHVWVWYKNDWGGHPIAKTLSRYSNAPNNWKSVASDINVEFRRIDKTCINTGYVLKTVVTDNWIMKLMPYKMEIAHQSDISLALLEADHHVMSPDSSGSTQYLNIEVQSCRERTKPFFIRLNAVDFKDLQDKLQMPIVNLKNVVIHKTLSDKFQAVFRDQVMSNERFHSSEEFEPCIGCMQAPAEIKLQRRCIPVLGERSCVACYCRPMWCIECMAKWFASRQDQDHPETWLGSRCPCPTCRSPFCILDVSLIEDQNGSQSSTPRFEGSSQTPS